MKPADKATSEGILFTDQYQLTMAQLYYRLGYHEQPVQFDHFFRTYPNYGTHKAGFCVNAGLDWLLDWMAQVRFRDRTRTTRHQGLGALQNADDFTPGVADGRALNPDRDMQAAPI